MRLSTPFGKKYSIFKEKNGKKIFIRKPPFHSTDYQNNWAEVGRERSINPSPWYHYRLLKTKKSTICTQIKQGLKPR